MKHSIVFLLLTCCVGTPTTRAGAPNPALDIVSRYEATFSAPPSQATGGSSSRATDAPLLGNGDLGVCISGPPEKQVFWITKNDFWYLKNGDAVPLNFGTLQVAAPALSNAGYAVRQSIVDAITTGSFTGKDSTVTETTFVAATANVMVLTLSCQGKPVEMEISFQPNDYHNLDAGWRAHFDTAGQPVEVDAGQLPGACRNWFTVDAYATMHSANRGAALFCPDAPMAMAGGFNFDPPLAALPRPANPLLLAWPLNNYWNTNFPLAQPGRIGLRYGLLTYGIFDADEIARQAVAFTHPIIVHPAFVSSASY